MMTYCLSNPESFLIPLGIGTFFILLGATWLRYTKSFLKGSKLAKGTITHIIDENILISYSANGDSFDSIKTNFYHDRMKVGQTIPIAYKIDDPSQFIYYSRATVLWLPLIFIILGILPFIVTMVLVLVGIIDFPF